MMYYLYVEQPHGCDYTIACGKLLHDLETDNLPIAIEKAKQLVLTHRGEQELEAATLLQVMTVQNLDVEYLYKAAKTIQQIMSEEKAKELRLQQYRELQKEFGP